MAGETPLAQSSSTRGKITLAVFILAVCTYVIDLQRVEKTRSELRNRMVVSSPPGTETLAKTFKAPSLPQTSVYKHNNSDTTAGVKKCTEEQRKKVDRQLQLSDPTNPNTLLQFFFRCPESSWLEDFLRHQQTNDASKLHPFLGISIGCNKGQDAIKLARVGTGSAEYDVDTWLDSVAASLSRNWTELTTEELDRAFACGRTENDDSDLSGTRRAGELHCVEPLPSNFVMLQDASAKLGLSEDNGWHLTQAAVSSVDGTIKFPDARPGTESLGMQDCFSNSTGAKCVDVPMYSLESFVAKYVKSLGPIDVLQIDVEGWDFDVLFGAGSVLDRTKYIEFEYHKVGHVSQVSNYVCLSCTLLLTPHVH